MSKPREEHGDSLLHDSEDCDLLSLLAEAYDAPEIPRALLQRINRIESEWRETPRFWTGFARQLRTCLARVPCEVRGWLTREDVV